MWIIDPVMQISKADTIPDLWRHQFSRESINSSCAVDRLWRYAITSSWIINTQKNEVFMAAEFWYDDLTFYILKTAFDSRP